MLPQLFLDRMKEMLGEEYPAFIESFAHEKYQALRLNALKYTGEELPFHLNPVPWAENGFYYEAQDQPGKHPYHEAGVYYIQEPSAMAPVTLLSPKPGERILDLCAAPGGKSTQIAALMQGEGLLVSNEIHPARAKILSENIERMGVRNACVLNESPAALRDCFPEYFDRILVDAPCSGEGMFRKNEEACEEWSPENVKLCAARQDEILDCAAAMLRPGGTLVYSTCTFAVLENEGSIQRFLARNPGFYLVEDKRLWPHKVKGEGHYAALLRRRGESGYRRMPLHGLEEGVSEKELGEWPAFCEEALKFASQNKPQGDFRESIFTSFLKFGDNIYLAPEELPSLKGLRALRPGLQLGTLKKNRFEPSHALALALRPKDAVHVWNLKAGDAEIRAYLSGQTFPAEGEKGWYLICVDGYSIGWGKLAGGIMKNHYPKGLRKN